jgi:sugar-specific transcriptional regulator TrmB
LLREFSLFLSISAGVKVVCGLTQKWMLKTLVNFGLKQKEAQVYVYLAVNGPKHAKDIAEALNTYKLQVYRSLRKLQSKEIVNATSNRPAEFYAVSFERVLDIFMQAAVDQAKDLQASKEVLLSTWQTMIIESSINN